MKTFIRLFFPTLAATLVSLAQTAAPDLLTDARSRPSLSLADFEKFAFDGNPTLTQAQANIRRSAARAAQQRLWPNPTVGYQGEQIRGGSYGGGEQGAFVQQNIILGGKLALRSAAVGQQRHVDEIAASEQRSRVRSDVDQTFYSALAAQETVHLRQQLLTLANNAVETARQLQNVGQADLPDLLQAEVEAGQAVIEYTSAQRRYLATFRGLAALAGKPDLPLSPLAGNLDAPPSIDSAGIAAQIVRDSPALKRALQQVTRFEAESKAARREAVPDLFLRAGVEQNNEQLGVPNRGVGLQAFATVGVSLPLFNRNQGNVSAVEAGLENARAEATRVRLSLARDTQMLLQTFLANQAQAELYRSQLIPRAQRAYDLYLAKYRQMAAAYPQVIVSQRTLFQLRVAYIGVLRDLWTGAAALENYTLSDGLSAPADPAEPMSPNLPAVSNGG
jgi:cobalt-zinc-cadmium efflux system outer membrane protein